MSGKRRFGASVDLQKTAFLRGVAVVASSRMSESV